MQKRDQEKYPNYRTGEKAWMTQAVIKATAEAIWDHTNRDAQPNHRDMANIVRRKRASIGDPLDEADHLRPEALWQLTADILLHLPIVFGLPDDLRGNLPDPKHLLPPPTLPSLTTDAIRQRSTKTEANKKKS